MTYARSTRVGPPSSLRSYHMPTTQRFDLVGRPPEAWWPHLAAAAALLRNGGLVAFPTETVYGLGASALSAQAVAGIFAAKGRPADNPLIVHVANVADAQALAAEWPPLAERAAAEFWPGPLTLVVRRAAQIPNIVVAGGSTVAVRVPAHPIAATLLHTAGIPIAAPSANRSTRLSPTTAVHVLDQLAGRIDAVVDGGPTTGGIESTVLDVTTTPARILRPGLLDALTLEAALKTTIVEAPSAAVSTGTETEMARSPGQRHRHYAPRAEVKLLAPGASQPFVALQAANLRVGWLQWDVTAHTVETAGERLVTIIMPPSPVEYARRLYAALHELDAAGCDVIVVDRPPDSTAWRAIHDRLQRAAAPPEMGRLDD